jgi:hypothetical protein
MAELACPSCRKKIHPPDHLAGRRVTCPRCNAVVVVPSELAQAVEEACTKQTLPADEAPEAPPFPTSARLGAVALALGSTAILILCLPVIGYLSTGLSGIGLLLGFIGLVRSRKDSGETLPPLVVSGAGQSSGFGARARDYPLAAVAMCLLALILALVPVVSKWID